MQQRPPQQQQQQQHRNHHPRTPPQAWRRHRSSRTTTSPRPVRRQPRAFREPHGVKSESTAVVEEEEDDGAGALPPGYLKRQRKSSRRRRRAGSRAHGTTSARLDSTSSSSAAVAGCGGRAVVVPSDGLNEDQSRAARWEANEPPTRAGGCGQDPHPRPPRPPPVERARLAPSRCSASLSPARPATRCATTAHVGRARRGGGDFPRVVPAPPPLARARHRPIARLPPRRPRVAGFTARDRRVAGAPPTARRRRRAGSPDAAASRAGRRGGRAWRRAWDALASTAAGGGGGGSGAVAPQRGRTPRLCEAAAQGDARLEAARRPGPRARERAASDAATRDGALRGVSPPVRPRRHRRPAEHRRRAARPPGRARDADAPLPPRARR